MGVAKLTHVYSNMATEASGTGSSSCRESTVATDYISSSDSESDNEAETTTASDLPSLPTSTGSGTSNSPMSPSLLDHLKAPLRSELTRKRAIRKNPSATQSQRKKRPSCSTDPKSASPSSRVREFPNEHLAVSAGKLFCDGCREELSLKRSIIANHIASVKHKQSKVRLARTGSRERDIAEALVSYDQRVHPRGETLSTDQRVYRIKVVMSFLKAGVPLAKLDHFRDILEEHAYRLCDRRGMSDLIPYESNQERDRSEACFHHF